MYYITHVCDTMPHKDTLSYVTDIAQREMPSKSMTAFHAKHEKVQISKFDSW